MPWPQAPGREPFVFLHSCGLGSSFVFEHPVEVLSVPWAARIGGFERLREFLDRHRQHFCAGYLGYDLRDDVEEVRPLRTPDQDRGPSLPVLWVAAFAERRELPRGVGGVDLFAGLQPAAEQEDRIAAARRTRAAHEGAVLDVIESIRAGDIFQANLTQPFDTRWDDDPRVLFARLCARSPAEFAAYVDAGAEGFQVLSSSPEEFLRRDAGLVRTRPIKGTRPRGANPVQDAALAAELADSRKDLAELAMIVDLLRNDLGKVARVDTVRVGPFPETMQLPQLHHLVATVTAELRDGVDTVDLLRATFPGGSITGAPKQRCMEILEDLEVARRGVYTGAIGHFGPGPFAHLNVAIRTLVRKSDGRVRFDVGGGVTARSDPAAEYQECLDKARGMLAALGARLG
jgi:para-aminobenzoate synthetase component 1